MLFYLIEEGDDWSSSFILCIFFVEYRFIVEILSLYGVENILNVYFF